MRGVWWVVAATLLAGCAQTVEPAGELAREAGTAVTIDLGAALGHVAGVVVNDAIRPVSGATVALVGRDREVATDEGGGFAFADVPTGPLILQVSKPDHVEAQIRVEVKPGTDEPATVRLVLERLPTVEPYMLSVKHQGFMQCGITAVIFGSVPCITDHTAAIRTPGLAPQLRDVQDEQRGWQGPLAGGWQTLVWEMTWEPSPLATFEELQLFASFDRSNRSNIHNFMHVAGGSPLRAQVDVGIDHPGSNSVEPELIPPEGLPDLYHFTVIGQNGPIPTVAINQEYELHFTSFFHASAPDGWSLLNGDDPPF